MPDTTRVVGIKKALADLKGAKGNPPQHQEAQARLIKYAFQVDDAGNAIIDAQGNFTPGHKASDWKKNLDGNVITPLKGKLQKEIQAALDLNGTESEEQLTEWIKNQQQQNTPRLSERETQILAALDTLHKATKDEEKGAARIALATAVFMIDKDGNPTYDEKAKAFKNENKPSNWRYGLAEIKDPRNPGKTIDLRDEIEKELPIKGLRDDNALIAVMNSFEDPKKAAQKPYEKKPDGLSKRIDEYNTALILNNTNNSKQRIKQLLVKLFDWNGDGVVAKTEVDKTIKEIKTAEEKLENPAGSNREQIEGWQTLSKAKGILNHSKNQELKFDLDLNTEKGNEEKYAEELKNLMKKLNELGVTTDYEETNNKAPQKKPPQDKRRAPVR